MLAHGSCLAELGEDVVRSLTDDVHEHVEAAAVGHADDELVDAELGALLDDAVEHRDHRLRAGDREALRAEEAAVQELVDVVDAAPSVRSSRSCSAADGTTRFSQRLHARLQPVALDSRSGMCQYSTPMLRQ
jgi:hypothetical protein